MATWIPGLISLGLSAFGNKGPSREEMLADLKPFKDGLDEQLNRINQYRDRKSDFWVEQKNSLLNQAYNAGDLSSMYNNRMNFGAASGILNRQNQDTLTNNLQNTGNLLNQSWLNLQDKTDNMYDKYLSGMNQYSQALTGVRTAQYQQKQDRMSNITGLLNQFITPYDKAGSKTLWQDMFGYKDE